MSQFRGVLTYPEVLDGELEDGHKAGVGVDHLIRYIPVHEKLARLEANNLVGRDTRITASHPQELGGLASGHVFEEVLVVLGHRLDELTVSLIVLFQILVREHARELLRVRHAGSERDRGARSGSALERRPEGRLHANRESRGIGAQRQHKDSPQKHSDGAVKRIGV
eukprot:3792975-Rhodomonas_salina.2